MSIVHMYVSDDKYNLLGFQQTLQFAKNLQKKKKKKLQTQLSRIHNRTTLEFKTADSF